MNGNSLYGQPPGRDRFTVQLALALAGRTDLQSFEEIDSLSLSSQASGNSFQRHLAEALREQ